MNKKYTDKYGISLQNTLIHYHLHKVIMKFFKDILCDTVSGNFCLFKHAMILENITCRDKNINIVIECPDGIVNCSSVFSISTSYREEEHKLEKMLLKSLEDNFLEKLYLEEEEEE